MGQKLDEELEAREYFKSHYDGVYQSVNDVEKVFLRICAILPEIKKIYKISQAEIEKINVLEKSVDDLGFKYTTSIGYNKIDNNKSYDENIAIADELLYKNKELSHQKYGR